MVQLICLLFPSVIAVWIYEALTKKQLGLKKWIYYFCFNALAVNTAVFLVKKFISHTSNQFLAMPGADMVPEVAIRYIIMALPLSIALAVVSALLSKNVKVTMEDNEDKSNDKGKDGDE